MPNLMIVMIAVAAAAPFALHYGRVTLATVERKLPTLTTWRPAVSAPQWPRFRKAASPDVIAPLFTPEVTQWEDEILRWSAEHGVEPNLLATVMQIESCGHPTVNSWAGAQGLFQVMPFHFDDDENMLDPDTNAMRGANFLRECTRWSSGDVGLTLACYNGGPGVISRPGSTWPSETRRYYAWGVGIYADALTQKDESATLDSWLAAGGARLCTQARVATGLR